MCEKTEVSFLKALRARISDWHQCCVELVARRVSGRTTIEGAKGQHGGRILDPWS